MGVGRAARTGKDWPGKYVQTDFSSASLTRVIQEFAPEVVFHGAGTASVGASMAEPLIDLQGSALTCANVFEAVRQSGIKPLIVMPSSAAVYGNPQALPVNEEAIVQPISPYGFHKAICELLAREYAECFGLDFIICRFFSVFGAAQRRLLIWELHQQLAGPNEI